VRRMSGGYVSCDPCGELAVCEVWDREEHARQTRPDTMCVDCWSSFGSGACATSQGDLWLALTNI
jgi:hypothetical protein